MYTLVARGYEFSITNEEIFQTRGIENDNIVNKHSYEQLRTKRDTY